MINNNKLKSLCFDSIRNRKSEKSTNKNICYHFENGNCRYKRICNYKITNCDLIKYSLIENYQSEDFNIDKAI